MRFNAASEEKAIVNGEELEDVDSFVYLGAKVSTAGGADDDINSRLCKARAVLLKLSGVWKSSILSKSTKIRIFKSNVIAVMLYGCESWRVTRPNLIPFSTNACVGFQKFIGLYTCPMKKCAGEPTLRPSAN